MNLTIYRQFTRERQDGTIVYKGEDARPYVDERIFFVADGLGGGGAISHLSINEALFDEKKLMETLFYGVYADYDDEIFEQYVKDSFYELIVLKDCYRDNIHNVKNSGFFGSRLATAVLLHEMIYNKDLEPKLLFDLYNSQKSPEEKSELLFDLGDYIANILSGDMKKIARNANLFYESNISNLALLGTTLCATIYCQSNDIVETIYLTAGDSRPYLWSEDQGLCQLVEDQERKEDGGMTNYIKVNEDASFSIRCNYMKFCKPCVLFNASDGIFDSAYFNSNLSFEKYLLDRVVEASDIQNLSELITNDFLTYGRHDDSSTMAMKIFGYESFDCFQQAASRRIDFLGKEYITQLDNLLSSDYNTEYIETDKKIKELNDKKETLRELAEKQTELFEKYDKNYNQYMKGEIE